jgi:hypothetical protein
VTQCDACHEDFGSLSAFDAHRVGRHGYSLTEGLRREPPVEDGRRCLAPWELEAAGWARDQHGRWRRSSHGWDASKTFQGRTLSASEAPGGLPG